MKATKKATDKEELTLQNNNMDTKGKLVKVTNVFKSEEEYEDSDGNILPIGSDYYWYYTRVRSAAYPKKSELAVSFFFKGVYKIEELLEKVSDKKDVQYVKDRLQTLIDSQSEHLLDMIASKIRSVRNKKIEERINELMTWASKIEKAKSLKEFRQLKYGE